MSEKINEEKEKLNVEFENSKKALKQVKEQIIIFNKKGEELTAHLNYLKGAIDILEQISKEKDGD